MRGRREGEEGRLEERDWERRAGRTHHCCRRQLASVRGATLTSDVRERRAGAAVSPSWKRYEADSKRIRSAEPPN
jgi:hypothetical protein